MAVSFRPTPEGLHDGGGGVGRRSGAGFLFVGTTCCASESDIRDTQNNEERVGTDLIRRLPRP